MRAFAASPELVARLRAVAAASLVLAGAALGVVGCGDSDEARSDAALARDASSGTDVRGSGDAAAVTDAGASPDASAGSDAAGPPKDGSTSAADGSVADGSAADGAASSCTPTAPIDTRARFAALRTKVAAAADATARQAAVDAFLVALGDAYPLRDGQGAVIVATAPGLSIAGSFNGWAAGKTKLARLADTTLYYVELAIGAAEHEYKLVDGSGAWSRDTRNRHVRWDGIPRAGLGAFNSVIPPFRASLTTPTKGRIEAMRAKSAGLGNTRDVFVYLPPGYDADRCTKRPLLVVNDGNESLTRSQLDRVADTVIAGGKARAAVLAFVALAEQKQRLDEYGVASTSKGRAYVDFLCNTLVPTLQARYRLDARAAQRGVIGASMGGLSAFAALFWRNDCFHRAGAQSGSFWYENGALIARAKAAPKVTLANGYLDNGTDNRTSTLAMRDALRAAGYTVTHRENLSHGHDWSAWRARFSDALSTLFPTKSN